MQELPDEMCGRFNMSPKGPAFTCGFFTAAGLPCGKAIQRTDRFKDHLQTHLGLTPYSCAESKAIPTELKWCA